jgi:hypothetical protein
MEEKEEKYGTKGRKRRAVSLAGELQQLSDLEQ